MQAHRTDKNGKPIHLRFDLKQIASWIFPGARVLDLGCGEGNLLKFLKDTKNAVCTGIEQDEAKVSVCIEKGLSVLHGDINQEIRDYAEKTFDFVILSQTLQQVFGPEALMRNMMRVGCRGIVSFPIFSHWACRFQLLVTGRAPVTRQLPYQWYDTPNIRVITLKDFRKFAKDAGLRIIREVAMKTDPKSENGRIVTLMPNLRGVYGIFMVGDRDDGPPTDEKRKVNGGQNVGYISSGSTENR